MMTQETGEKHNGRPMVWTPVLVPRSVRKYPLERLWDFADKCVTYGQLVSPAKNAKYYAGKYFPCGWCQITLKNLQSRAERHIPRCPYSPIRDYNEWEQARCKCQRT